MIEITQEQLNKYAEAVDSDFTVAYQSEIIHFLAECKSQDLEKYEWLHNKLAKTCGSNIEEIDRLVDTVPIMNDANDLAEKVKGYCFNDMFGRIYAYVYESGGYDILEIESEGFRDYLRYINYEMSLRPASEEKIGGAIAKLKQNVFDKPEKRIYQNMKFRSQVHTIALESDMPLTQFKALLEARFQTKFKKKWIVKELKKFGAKLECIEGNPGYSKRALDEAFRYPDEDLFYANLGH